ncbi:MAG: HAD-IC family P-type ATPase [Spirochaetales bacterium]|nr:HAD-IC family P-type ATPase [Spirochaetales bacterium]
MTEISRPWELEVDQVITAYSTDAENGLANGEVDARTRQYGQNALTAMRRTTALDVLVRQFKSLIVLLLAAAAAVAFSFGEVIDGSAIIAVILLNTAIGFFTEIRAVRSMEALSALTKASVRVRREGVLSEVDAESLVPGDIAVVEAGDIVSADMRIVTASRLRVDESALTGESVPVDKQTAPVPGDAVLAERANMLFKGTKIIRGSGDAVVTATGMQTELGTISSLVTETKDEKTPLEKQLAKLGNRLIWITLGIAVVVVVAGVLSGKELRLMIETSIALAVAAIPEGLPIVATIALARGMWRMARKNALINRLSAVETLGATSVICTDKTGTLTENSMTIQKVITQQGEYEFGGSAGESTGEPDDSVKAALTVGVLCNNASLTTGDPMEMQLLSAGEKAGIKRGNLLERLPECGEEAFDSETKMMATMHRGDGGCFFAVKGAPEAVLGCCKNVRDDGADSPLTESARDSWLEKNAGLASEGLRVLALAEKHGDENDKPYENLVFLGFVTYLDPPRSDVRPSILKCRAAGIRVVMVTGDQAETARSIAAQVGLEEPGRLKSVRGADWVDPKSLDEKQKKEVLDSVVFSRFSPRQKMDLIDLHQQSGSIVAMTGDGVNDAPALKKADIGIAMGHRGTQVAKEAADMVLKDDAFSTIVAAVEQGRVIFENIRAFIVFLLSCNIAEILIIFLASFISMPLPILPLQILFLNLVTDIFPALALGVGEGDDSVMRRKPRDPHQSIVSFKQWQSVFIFSALISLTVLGSLIIAQRVLGLETRAAVTVSFLTLAFAQLWHVFNMRVHGSRLLKNSVTTNRYVWYALALCTLLLAGAVYLPGISAVLRVVPPDAKGWLVISLMSLLPAVIGQVLIKLGITSRPTHR